MRQPWIHKPLTDGVFILAPAFFVSLLVIIFHDTFRVIEDQYSFYTWLFLIVFIDVAHVYATLFKTYFVPEAFKARRALLLVLPLVCFFIGMLLFSFGSTVFWSCLAYIAVFHFIRQQYGFMRLYSRLEVKTKWTVFFDNLFIYTATVYPMLYWFLSSPRAFTWFTEHDFFRVENSFALEVLGWIYGFVLLFYVLRTAFQTYQQKFFNLPKNAIIVGTFLSWYLGIVHYNNDLIFTLLNVVAHGIPYMALIYLNEIHLKKSRGSGIVAFVQGGKGWLVFIGVLVLIAFSEEYLWEVLVWQEHFSSPSLDMAQWQIIIVPLLTVPQFTHYLLDGFIWKSNK